MNKEKSTLFIADMHTHSEHSQDSSCTIENALLSQAEKGTKIFAVTDHFNTDSCDDCDIYTPILTAHRDIDEMRKKYPEITVLKGIEIGEGFWRPEVFLRAVSMAEYDLIIGSVHKIRYPGYAIPYSQINFSEMGLETVHDYLDKYFSDMLKMIEETDFDILAHLTCPLRYIKGKYSLDISLHIYKEKIKKILEAIIKKNIALEVNTSCIGSAYNEFMPEEWIISLYRKMGGTLITLGSDAHVAKNASHSFAEALEMLKRNGFESLCYFQKRCIYKYEI